MNTEAAVISAVCRNKDIASVMSENVDEIFISHRDVWEGLKSYYLKFRAVPDVDVLLEKFKDFEPEHVSGETPYYLDKLKNEYLENKIKDIMLKNGAKLKKDSPTRVLMDMQAQLSSLSKMTGAVRDVDLTDYELAEQHFHAVRARSNEMGGSPGIMTGIKAIDLAYPTGMAPGHLIVAIGWPGRGKTWFTSYLACQAWNQGFKPNCNCPGK